MTIHQMHVETRRWHSLSEDRFLPPETVATESWVLPCGCWDSNLSPVEEHRVLLTEEPSL